MAKYSELAKMITKNIGGKENVRSLTHCITRLRFKLNNETKADVDALKALDGVVTVIKSAGQFQVVIGNHVGEVYEEVGKIIGINVMNEESHSDEKTSVFARFVDIISSCFSPILSPMTACGIIKGLNALLIFLLGNTYSVSGTYNVLNAVGDSVFYFLPIILGYSSAKKFKVNPVTGMLLGAALCYPSIQLDSIRETGKILGTLPVLGDFYSNFIGIPLVAGNYTGTVLPIILIVLFASKIQVIAKKSIPEMLQNFFVPFFTLIISLPVGLLIIGPIITLVTNGLSFGFESMYDFSPIFTGGLLGALWLIFVIFGVHWIFVAMAIINISTAGFDLILVATFSTCFAQAAALFAMYLKMKDEKKKVLAVPAMISAFCGVTEPSIYGFTLPAKKPFIMSCIAGGVGGAVFTALGAKYYILGGLGIFGVVNYISPEGNAWGMYASFIAIALASGIAFILTYLTYSEKETPSEKELITTSFGKNIDIISPMSGSVIPLSQVKDEAFSEGLLGTGVAVIPTSGNVIAPISGILTILFPTLHAFGITSDDGTEVLVHIGLNTVELNGDGFISKMKQGDKVKQGEIIMTVDLDKLKTSGYSIETPIVITKYRDGANVKIVANEEIISGEDLLIIE